MRTFPAFCWWRGLRRGEKRLPVRGTPSLPPLTGPCWTRLRTMARKA
nr:MAG TPA: hypothetical protein [Caudoviricetes sp.]